MRKTMYKDIRIQVNVTDPSVQALLDFFDQYTTRQRNRMIVDVLITHFVGSASISGFPPKSENNQSATMDNNRMMQLLMDQINRLSEKVEKMESNARESILRKGEISAEAKEKVQDKRSEEKKIEKPIPEFPAPNPDIPEESIPDVPDAILSFLESMQ